MTSKILLITPSYDKFTASLSREAGYLVDLAREKGVDLKLLGGPDVTRKKYVDALTEFRPDTITFFGVSDASRIYGRNDVLLTDSERADELAGMNIYVFGNDSAITFGPACMEKRASGFLGFIGPVGFAEVKSTMTAGFREAILQPAVSFINGQDARRAYDETIKSYDKWIKYWTESVDPMKIYYISWLWHNRNDLRVNPTPARE